MRTSTRLARVPHKSMKEDSGSEDEASEAVSTDDEMTTAPAAPEERQAPVQKPRKQAAKQPTLDAALEMVPPPSRRKKSALPIVVQGEQSLLEVLIKHPDLAQAAAKSWVGRYKNNPVPATADLLSLLAQVAGVQTAVSENDVEEGDVDSLARRLAHIVMQEGGMDLLHDRRTARTLAPGFAAFFTNLVSELDEAELLTRSADDFAFDKLMHTVMALSCSVVRPFRLAATLAGSRLVGAMIEARKRRTQALSTAQFQKETESKKGRAANQAVLQSAKQNVDLYQRQCEALTSHINELIKTVFAVRFRDNQAEVRALVIRSIGSWVAADPAAFLVDSQLKYLGWALSDKDAMVRLCAVRALISLYQDPANTAGLRDFKARFLERLQELPFDVDAGVAELALQLLHRLVSLKELSPPDVRGVVVLLADRCDALREGAGQVVAGMLLCQVDDILKEQAGPGGDTQQLPAGEGRTKATAATTPAAAAAPRGAGSRKVVAQQAAVRALLDMMAWMQPVDFPAAADPGAVPPLEQEVVGMVVGALYDKYPVLHDVSQLAAVLTSMEGADSRIGGPAGPAHLASVLSHVVHKSVPEPAAGQGTAKGRGTKRKHSSSSVTIQEVTRALMGPLPALIRKFKTEPAVLAPLLRVAGCLHLELFAEQGEERAFGALLALVSEQVQRHSQQEVLKEAAECLVHAATQGPGSLKPAAQRALSETVSKVAAALTSAAAAVRKLPATELAEQEELLLGVSMDAAEQAAVPEGADVLWKLYVALLRATALLSRGAADLAGHAPTRQAMSQLLSEAGTGRVTAAGMPEGPRALTPLVMGQLLVASNISLMLDLLQLGAKATPLPDAGGQAGVQDEQLDKSEQSPREEEEEGEGGGEQHKGGRGRFRAGRAGRGTGRGRAGGKEAAVSDGEGVQGDSQGRGRKQQGRGGDVRGDVTVESVRDAAAVFGGQLRDLHAAVQDDADTQELVMRAISDLLLQFGYQAWKGTPAEDCNLDPDMVWQLLHCLWSSCVAALDTAVMQQEELEAQVTGDDEYELGQQAGPRTALAACRLAALGAAARLPMAPAALSREHSIWLAGRLLAQMPYHGVEVEQLIRDMVTKLRQNAAAPGGGGPQVMADMLFSCLQCGYETVEEQALEQAAALEQGDTDMAALQQALTTFGKLPEKLAELYAVAGVNREELVCLLRSVTSWVFTADTALSRMYMMAWGLAQLVPKLTPGDAEILVGELREAMAEAEQVHPRQQVSSDEGEEVEEVRDPHWAQVDHYLSVLQERAAKGQRQGGGGGGGRGGRGALKGSRAAAARATAQEAGADDAAEGRGRRAAGGKRTAAQMEGSAGEEEEEEAARPRAKARFARGGVASGGGGGAGQGGAEMEVDIAPGAAVQQGRRGGKAGRGKRAAAGKQAPVVIPSNAGWRESKHVRGTHLRQQYTESQEDSESEGEHAGEEQDGTQAISDDAVLPRAPPSIRPLLDTAASPTARHPGVNQRQTLQASDGEEDDMYSAEGEEEYDVQEEGEGQGAGGQQGGTAASLMASDEDDDDEDGDDGDDDDDDGLARVLTAPAPSQSTQTSQLPTRLTRRRRL